MERDHLISGGRADIEQDETLRLLNNDELDLIIDLEEEYDRCLSKTTNKSMRF